MANRFISGLLVLSFVGVCYSYQGGDAGLNRDKQADDKKPVLVRMSVQLPTPGKEEGVVIFENGDFMLIKIGQLVSIPATERFRGVWGESTAFIFREKGATSGNNLWVLDRR